MSARSNWRRVGVLAVVLVVAYLVWPRDDVSEPGLDPGQAPSHGGAGRNAPALATASAPPEKPQADLPKKSDGRGFAEPTHEALRALERTYPHDGIAGIVLRGSRPVDAGRVELRFAPPSEETAVRPRRIDDEAAIGADGTFRFDKLKSGTYWLRVRVDGASPRELSWTLREDREQTVWFIVVLGTGTVAGHLFDERGVPLRNHAVRASRHGLTLGHLTTPEARTDHAGAYELTGLLSGRYGVTFYDAWKPYDPATARYGTVDVKAGETSILTLGTDRPSGLWSGVVRNADGHPIRGPARLIAAPAGGGEALDLEVAKDGSFSFRAPPGRYGLTVRKSEGRLKPHRGVRIGDRHLTQDIVLPGAHVVGEVRDPATGERYAHVSDQGVYYTPVGKDHHARKFVSLEPDGTFSIDGLLPGVYVISGWPRALVGTGRELVKLRVSATDRHLELNLELRDR